MNIPCPKKVDCPCDNNPFNNLSSEAPDRRVFLAFNTGWDINSPNPGDHFDNPDGFAFCESPISQDDADLCAAREQVDNQINGGGADPGDRTDSGGNSYFFYNNSAQTCSVNCPDGSQFSYTIAAGGVRMTSIEMANRIAQSLACIYANKYQVCISSLTGGCMGESYDEEISVGSTVQTPVDWQLRSGMLPPGLEVQFDLFDTRRIGLSGTPTTPGNYSFVIRATDANGNYMEKAFNVPILGITNEPTQPSFGVPYSFQLNAEGGTAPYDFAVDPGALPAGLSMNDNGLITGTATSTDSKTFTVTFTDSNNEQCAKVFTLTPIGATPVQLGGACVGEAYDAFDIWDSTSNLPWNYEIVAGSIPPGMSTILWDFGVIFVFELFGTPNTGGFYDFTVKFTDSLGNVEFHRWQVGVINFTGNAPPSGMLGTAYSYQLSATGGSGTITFAITGGSLPAGLSMNSSGLISGTPTTAGATSFTVQASDTAGDQCSQTFNMDGGIEGWSAWTIIPTTSLSPPRHGGSASASGGSGSMSLMAFQDVTTGNASDTGIRCEATYYSVRTFSMAFSVTGGGTASGTGDSTKRGSFLSVSATVNGTHIANDGPTVKDGPLSAGASGSGSIVPGNNSIDFAGLVESSVVGTGSPAITQTANGTVSASFSVP